jgi:hypothetical protein
MMDFATEDMDGEKAGIFKSSLPYIAGWSSYTLKTCATIPNNELEPIAFPEGVNEVDFTLKTGVTIQNVDYPFETILTSVSRQTSEMGTFCFDHEIQVEKGSFFYQQDRMGNVADLSLYYALEYTSETLLGEDFQLSLVATAVLVQGCTNEFTDNANYVTVFDDFFVSSALTEYKDKEVNDEFKGKFFKVLIAFLVVNIVLLIVCVILLTQCLKKKNAVTAAEKDKKEA